MNRNQIKILACVTMLIDHIGYLLLPQYVVFRIIGRIAMPLYAYFIGEGCRYTHDRKKHFLNVLTIAIVSMAIKLLYYFYRYGYINLTNGVCKFNILFSFAVSIVACGFYLEFRRTMNMKNKVLYLSLFIISLIGFKFILYIFGVLKDNNIFSSGFEYNYFAFILPVSVVIFENKWLKFGCFSVFLLFYCLRQYTEINYVWFCLFALIPLAFYNESSGTKKYKYWFYVFYPAHLTILYILQAIIY